MRYVRPEDGEKLPGDLAGLGITRPEWHALQDDLLALNAAGALGGIRAIVAERQAAAPGPVAGLPNDLPTRAKYYLAKGDYARAAALLAAELDRQAAP